LDNKKTVFRQKALDRLRSPDDLNDYIKVTTPSVWIVLVAFLVLTAGLFVWGVCGSVAVTDTNGTVKQIAPITLLIGSES